MQDKKVTGASNCIRITLKDGKTFYFFDLEKTSKVYMDIIAQADKLNLNIEHDFSAEKKLEHSGTHFVHLL